MIDRTKKVTYCVAALISLATLAVYLRTLQNDFVVLDDDVYVYDNPHIRSFGMPFLRWAFFHFYACNWHPLTWVSHALDYAVWGFNPLGHHLTNIILHAVNTFIVVLLAMRLLESWTRTGEQKKPPAFRDERTVLITAGVTGVLFGLHPLHVESVAWIAERKDLLCAFFFLLSILSYSRYVRGIAGEAAERNLMSRFFHRDFLATGGLFLLALLSKPMAVTLPAVLLILDWHPFNRIHSLKTFRSALAEKLPFLALSIMSSILTMYAQSAGRAIVPVTLVPLSTRLLVAAKSLAGYLWKMAVPVDLVPYYPYPEQASLFSGEYLLAIAFVIAITAASLVTAHKQKLWLSGWAYYVITLVPVIGIVQAGGQAMADRYTYLPSLGPFLVAGWVVAWCFNRIESSRKRWKRAVVVTGSAVTVLAFLLLAFLTFQQCGIWKDSLAVLNYVLNKERQNIPAVYLYRGIAFEKAGRIESALDDYNRAIALDPSYADAYNSRGVLYQKKGRTDRAMEDFNKAILLNPSSVRAYFNLGVIHAETGLYDQAIANFSRALSLEPTSADAYVNRGISYAVTNRQSMALADFNKAIELNKRSPDAYFNRGKLYYSVGRKELAREDFQKACNLGDAGGCNALKNLNEEIDARGK